MNWKFWKKAEKINPVTLRYGMTLARWREQPNLIAECERIYSTRWFENWYSVLVTERPKGYSEKSDLQLGRMNGFEECLQLIAIMAEHPVKPAHDIEPTWGVPEEESVEIK